MAQQGMRFAGYTLVLDDNWPSRAAARKLGAPITGNFVAYRRELWACLTALADKQGGDSTAYHLHFQCRPSADVIDDNIDAAPARVGETPR